MDACRTFDPNGMASPQASMLVALCGKLCDTSNNEKNERLFRNREQIFNATHTPLVRLWVKLI